MPRRARFLLIRLTLIASYRIRMEIQKKNMEKPVDMGMKKIMKRLPGMDIRDMEARPQSDLIPEVRFDPHG